MTPRHLALAIGLAAVWGFNFVVMQVGLRHFPPLLYAGLRFAMAAFPALLLVGRPGVPWRWVAGVAATIGVGQFGLLLMGMRAGMPAGLTSLVLQVQALFTVLFAVTLLGERLTARRVAGLGLAFAGLALVAVDFGLAGPAGAFALCVAAAAAWGLGNVVQRRAAPPDSLRFMVWVSALSAPPLLALSLLVEGTPSLSAPAEGWLSLVYVAFVSTLGGFGVWGWLLRRYDASTVAPYTLLVPVFGLSSAALVTGEPLSWVKLVAGALIVCGVLYAGTRRAPAPAEPAPAVRGA
ncbi:EamA family transporter [Nonomuraea muscovyensis]|uniref:O-acetylserine/cysteine efflux transporter n=1 Tax=Nonomuraea muscovyensis TaxID=1124761 RepID=A0A7X0EZE1_9ACTN|nr:EamA family transporter [Nonomuraea muscovyensis]MBB6346655.1 O-acetylserine/cysteine efflux transporter [Nonomuraea muscovyensis]MDF2706503.1 EamA family transporter [Nonomuraea muscovyensis]